MINLSLLDVKCWLLREYFTSFDGNLLEIKYSAPGKLKQPKFTAIIRLMPFFSVNFSTAKHTQNDCSGAIESPASLKSLSDLEFSPMLFGFDWNFFSHSPSKMRKRNFISFRFWVWRKFVDETVHFTLNWMTWEIFRCFEFFFFFNNINFSRSFGKHSRNSIIFWFIQLPGYYTLNIPLCCWGNPTEWCFPNWTWGNTRRDYWRRVWKILPNSSKIVV